MRQRRVGGGVLPLGIMALSFGLQTLACSGSEDGSGGGAGTGATSSSGGSVSGGAGGAGGTGTGGSVGPNPSTGGTVSLETGGTVGVGGTDGAGGSGGSGGSGANGCGSNLVGTVRDFQASHPDFEYEFGRDRGIVLDTLGEDGKPVYANPEGDTPTTTGKENFDQWFNDVPGVNESEPLTLPFERGEGGVYTYDNSAFFPIDGEMMGDEDRPHNYHFTYELHTTFVYQGGEVFNFRGDDDVWTFINGHLAIDLGGVHMAEEASVDLDESAEELGLTIGQEYPLDFFFAERHTEESNFRIDTSIIFKSCGEPPPG